MYAFSVNCYNAPYWPIWIHIFEEVAFSVNCYSARYSPISIKFAVVHLDPCAFHCTKFDDVCIRWYYYYYYYYYYY